MGPFFGKHVPGKHALWIYGDKRSLAASQDFIFPVKDLGDIRVPASAHPKLPGFHSKRLIQGHWPKVVHGDLRGERDDFAQLVHLTHRIVEDSGNDSAVAMARRAGIALAETKAAHEAVALLVMDKVQVHAFRVVFPAGKTIILL